MRITPCRSGVSGNGFTESEIGQYRSNNAAGMTNGVLATQRTSAYSRYGDDSDAIWRNGLGWPWRWAAAGYASDGRAGVFCCSPTQGTRGDLPEQTRATQLNFVQFGPHSRGRGWMGAPPFKARTHMRRACRGAACMASPAAGWGDMPPVLYGPV